MYIPKDFITARAALDALMQMHHPELVELDRSLKTEKEWEATLFSISRAPPPIRPIHSGVSGHHYTRPISCEDMERRRKLRENIQRVDAGRRDVTLRLRAALAEEELQATIIMANGTTMVIGRNVWLPDKALDLLAQGYVEYEAFGYCQVVILRKNFEVWIKAAEANQVVPAPHASVLNTANKTGPKTTKTADAIASMIADYQGRAHDLVEEKLITLQAKYNVGHTTAGRARNAAIEQLMGGKSTG